MKIVAFLTLTLFIESCNLLEVKSKAPAAALTGANGNVALFVGNAHDSETTTWQYESGVEKSAVGNLNPVLLDRAKTPLLTPGRLQWEWPIPRGQAKRLHAQ